MSVLCRVHKPGIPNGPAPQQKLGLADDVANDAQLMGRPRYLNDRPEEGSSLRPDGLAKEGTTSASDSDPRLRPEGLAKEGTTLASDSDPRLRPGIHRTSAYGSSPTGAVGANWERPNGDTCSVRTQEIRRSR